MSLNLRLDSSSVTLSGMPVPTVPTVVPDPFSDDPTVQLNDVHRIATEHALYRAAQGMTVETVTVDHAGRETVTTKQLPPNVEAAKTILAATAPDRWVQSDRPVTAIQFVIHAPQVASSSQAWLEQYGPGAGRPVIEGTTLPAQLVRQEGGGLDPTGSGPVPDPVAVPHLPSHRLVGKI